MDEKKIKVSCIVCPVSCTGEVTMSGGEVHSLTGFTCERGKKYARAEVTAPQRTLTTTVKIEGGALPLLPVVSKSTLPKEKIREAVKFLSHVTVKAPVREGEVIFANILDLGVDIISSRDLGAA